MLVGPSGLALINNVTEIGQLAELGVILLLFVTGPDSIIFNGRDIREFVQSIKWFFGMGHRLHCGR